MSLSSTSWPVPATVSSWPCGSSASISREFSTGVRVSSRPLSSSAGTSGSGSADGGAGVSPSGQRRQSWASDVSMTASRLNGAKALSGSASEPWRQAVQRSG